MAYEPARGFRQTSSRTQSTRHPGGRTDRSHQPSRESNVSSQPEVSQPARLPVDVDQAPVLTAREERMRRREVNSGNI